ncbi:MAG: alpha/beta hydrolase [Cyanobacteria bacterium J06641_5]
MNGAFPAFLPPAVAQLQAIDSIAIARQIQRLDITTPLFADPVATSYVRAGEVGSPLLLLHGFDSSVLEFRRLLPLLTPTRQTWAVDLLGFGFTNRPPNLFVSPTAIRQHLYAFWEQAIAQPVILVGASMGGAAAIEFALDYPGAVAAIVLLDSAGAQAGPSMGKYLFPPLGYLAAEFLRQPAIRKQISRAAYFDKATFATPEADRCAALHLKLPGWHNALATFTKSGGYPALGDRLGEISVPALVVWGQDDGILGTRDAKVFAEGLPDRELVWIEKCGHVPHLEVPKDTAAAIANFLQVRQL